MTNENKVRPGNKALRRRSDQPISDELKASITKFNASVASKRRYRARKAKGTA